jgi:signal peptidase II
MSYEHKPPENDTGLRAPCSVSDGSTISSADELRERPHIDAMCVTSYEKETMYNTDDLKAVCESSNSDGYGTDVTQEFTEESDVTDVDSATEAVDHQKKSAIRRRYNRHAYFFSFFAFAVIADQFTKALAVYKLGYLVNNPTFGAFLLDYFSRIREFPWRLGVEGYKPAVDVVDGLFRWQLTTNTGAAYSMFSNNPGKLAIVSAVLSVFLYFLYLRFGKGSVIWPIAFGLQIGGAIGNFIDRARLGEVVDFVATKVPGIVDGRFRMIDFPIYNVADASAVVGTIVIGIMFVVKDVAASNLARKSRYETQYQQTR